jgi:hypothetical protein
MRDPHGCLKSIPRPFALQVGEEFSPCPPEPMDRASQRSRGGTCETRHARTLLHVTYCLNRGTFVATKRKLKVFREIVGLQATRCGYCARDSVSRRRCGWGNRDPVGGSGFTWGTGFPTREGPGCRMAGVSGAGSSASRDLHLSGLVPFGGKRDATSVVVCAILATAAP